MKSKLITVIPVYNGEKFIVETLESVAAQTVQPDRVVVIDNCSTDGTERLVRGFGKIRCEWKQNERNLGLFGNSNKSLELAAETEYLHILHADDLLDPKFYETMISQLETCDGRGLAFCLDERVDEQGRRLSVSGNPDGRCVEKPVDQFLREKAEISNQAWSGSLLKTHCQPAPCEFVMDMPILADVVFWASWGSHCKRIVQVNRPLSKYRWHGENTTSSFASDLQALVLDEWKTMKIIEKLRGSATGFVRGMKLKGLFAVRSGIKAKRFRQQGNLDYSRRIVAAARPIAGPLIWLMAQALVEFRDFVIYGIMRRPRHPKNVYS